MDHAKTLTHCDRPTEVIHEEVGTDREWSMPARADSGACQLEQTVEHAS